MARRNEWEIAMWICPYHQDPWQKLCPKVKQTEVCDCPENSLAAFAGTYGYWQQIKI